MLISLHADWWGRISCFLQKENYLILLLSNIFSLGGWNKKSFDVRLLRFFTLHLISHWHSSSKFFNRYFCNNLVSTRSRFGRSQQLWQSSIFFLAQNKKRLSAKNNSPFFTLWSEKFYNCKKILDCNYVRSRIPQSSRICSGSAWGQLSPVTDFQQVSLFSTFAKQ